MIIGRKIGRFFREYVSLVTSGSCGVVAHIKNSHLHVANVGDSMAILGVEGQEGAIKHIPVSKPHCVDNADEVSYLLCISQSKKCFDVFYFMNCRS